MVAHRVNIFHSVGGSSDFHAWLEQWLTNMEPWSYEGVDNDIPTKTEDEGTGDEYYSGTLAFDWDEDKAHILDNLDGYAEAYCDWHRILYHVCDHDENPPTPCSWEDVRENGDVPDYIISGD